MAFAVEAGAKINGGGSPGTWPNNLSISLTTHYLNEVVVLFVDIFTSSASPNGVTVSAIAPTLSGWTRLSRTSEASSEFPGDTLIKEIWWSVAAAKLNSQAIQITVADPSNAFADMCYSGFAVAGANTSAPWSSGSPFVNANASTIGSTSHQIVNFTRPAGDHIEIISICATGQNGGGNLAPQFTPADSNPQYALIENNPNLQGNFGSGQEWGRPITTQQQTLTYNPFPNVTTYDYIVLLAEMVPAPNTTPQENFSVNAGF